MKRAVDVLRELCYCIEVTGGILYRDGLAIPLGDPEWSDLGTVYLDACAVLGRVPYEAKDYDEEEDEG